LPPRVVDPLSLFLDKRYPYIITAVTVALFFVFHSSLLDINKEHATNNHEKGDGVRVSGATIMLTFHLSN
jgi:hypothetical protein